MTESPTTDEGGDDQMPADAHARPPWHLLGEDIHPTPHEERSACPLSPCSPPDDDMHLSPLSPRTPDAEEIHRVELESEQWAADVTGVRWQFRGGEPSMQPEGKKTWRKQRWRPGLDGGHQRYGNSGGKNREWYRAWDLARRKGKLQEFFAKYPKPDHGR